MDYRFENENMDNMQHNEGNVTGEGQYYTQTPLEPQPPKKGNTGARITALVLSCALVGGAMGFGGSALQNHLAAKDKDMDEESTQASVVYEGSRESSIINIAQIDTNKQMTPAEVYAQNVNSTVGIRTSITTNYWGYQTQSAAAGSGFILSADGYVLTNYHVVENSDSITVSLYNGEEYDATLVGCDQSNDIAVLKIDVEGLTPAVLGDSDNLNVGDQVVAIGNPLGELTFSLTTGAVSALNREVTLSSNVTMDLIQTDCAINSGNSGGALVNEYGQVIGINSSKIASTDYEGMAFSVPSVTAKEVYDEIVANGYVTNRPKLGITYSPASSSQMYSMIVSLKELPAGSLIVQSVQSDSSLASQDVKQGDLITKVNGKDLDSADDLPDLIDKSAVGDTLTLTICRIDSNYNINEFEVKATLVEDKGDSSSVKTESTTRSNSYNPFSAYGYGN